MIKTQGNLNTKQIPGYHNTSSNNPTSQKPSS